jgi:hypothetical protein
MRRLGAIPGTRCGGGRRPSDERDAAVRASACGNSGKTQHCGRVPFKLLDSRRDGKLGLIFGDDGGRGPTIEFVAEADLDLVFGQMMVDRKPACSEGRKREIRDMTEIGKAVFRSYRPIVGDDIFDAAANRPAGACLRNAV